MQLFTALVLAGFVVYGAAWNQGYVEGNFTVLLFAAVVVSCLYWLAERFLFAPKRKQAMLQMDEAIAAQQAKAQTHGLQSDTQALEKQKLELAQQPWWLDWTAGLFPVLLVVFVLRSFAFEPFKIPSGSMIPTLLVGDLIVVNKYTYGLRMPITHQKLTEGNAVARGDVVVFRYPPKPSIDFIKRVVALPGDKIAYLNKQLTINGQPIAQNKLPDFLDKGESRYFEHYQEQLDGHPHAIIVDPKRSPFITGSADFPEQERKFCQYSVDGVTCEVPPGHFFMVGDNRDNSLDSRYWGFVPQANVVGKAVFVWMNFGDLGRIGAIR